VPERQNPRSLLTRRRSEIRVKLSIRGGQVAGKIKAIKTAKKTARKTGRMASGSP
jgi:hypothetical protein